MIILQYQEKDRGMKKERSKAPSDRLVRGDP
jgi:hypothetical protein